MTPEKEHPQQTKGAERIETPRALLLGWLIFGILNAVATVLMRPIPVGHFWDLPTFLAYDFGHALLVGSFVSGVSAMLQRFSKGQIFGPWLWVFPSSVLCAVVGFFTLGDDLIGFASRLAGTGSPRMWQVGLMLGLPQLLILLGAIAFLFSRGIFRLLPLVGGALLCPANYLVLVGDYPGAHLLIAAAAATLISAGLKGLPALPVLEGRPLAVCALLVGLIAAVVPPPNAVLVHLNGTWASSLGPRMPRTWVAVLVSDPYSHQDFATEAYSEEWRLRSWLNDGDGGGRLRLPKEPIIIYYSVDSLRHDLLDAKHRKTLPNIHKLMDASVMFQRARSPGSQTVTSLTSIMAGTYFSQQYWTSTFEEVGKGFYKLWPREDTTIRFPEVLTDAGIPTVQYAQEVWLLNRYGMIRGISEEKNIKRRHAKRWPSADGIMDLIEKRLISHEEGPLFLFVHDLDPHTPFDINQEKRKAGEKRASRFQRYMWEVETVDARIGRLAEILRDTGLDERTIIIFSSDHGEAFSEHGTNFHGRNLYDEQVRVPLLVRVPGLPPRKVSSDVTLVALGPTILEMMGQTTPPHVMAGSLVPYLLGKSPKGPPAPVIAEGRLKRMMILPNNHKVIFDERQSSNEIYDLEKDPKELKNLYDSLGEEGKAMMQVMHDFFDRHRIKKKGYKIPYRR